MSLKLETAQRQQVKIKMSLSSPTGFGKTYSALLMAHGICGDWSKIAVIDTENASASLYSHLGAYKVVKLQPPFTTARYIEAIQLLEDNGIEVGIIDSCYHVWKGVGGILDYKESLGGKFSDWAKATPLYQKWIDKILQSKIHMICTNRKKQAYTLLNEGGKQKVEKAGLEDEIRDGFDYEMTIAFEIINDKHMVTVSKDRTNLFTGKQGFVINEDTGKLIKEWCESGVEAIEELTIEQEVDNAILQLANVENKEDLKLLGDGLLGDVRTNERFRNAAALRQKQFTKNNQQQDGKLL